MTALHRRIGLLLLALLGLVVASTAAAAQVGGDLIEEAADALAEDPVYVDDEAEVAPSPAEAEQLREAIRAAEVGPVYVAVLPQAAVDAVGGDPQGLLTPLGTALDRSGTYVAVAGRNLAADSTVNAAIEQGVVEDAEAAALAANQGGDVGPLLLDLVEEIDARVQGGAIEPEPPSPVGAIVVAGVVTLLVLGGGFLLVRTVRQNRRRDRERAEEIRAAALEDLRALDDDIRDLGLDADLSQDPDVKREQVHALESYSAASAGIDEASRPQDFEPVTKAIEDGRYAVASARARLRGEEPPERRPPCFFDPRHGPSVRDVEWAPDGGSTRPVPACAADAVRVEDGEQPVGRQVVVDGRSRPYWDAPGYWGPWAGGYYGRGGSGFLEGMLIGSWFSGGWGAWGGAGHSSGQGESGFGGFGDGGGGGFGGFGGGGGGFGGFGGGGGGGGGGGF